MPRVWIDPPDGHTPETCIKCAISIVINEHNRRYGLSPERLYKALVAITAELIAADAEGKPKHRYLAENFSHAIQQHLPYVYADNAVDRDRDR